MERGKRATMQVVDEKAMLGVDTDKVNKILDEIIVRRVNKKKLIEDICFNREKEDNWKIQEKAQNAGFINSENLKWLGYEVEMKVEITEQHVKVLEIQGIDVSDKEIFI